MEDKQNLTKINLVKTNTICFVSDCNATDGYDYEYHRSEIKNYYFDGKQPEPTFYPNWYKIEKYPQKVQRKVAGKTINARYELNDPEMESAKLPLVIKYEYRDNYDEDIRNTLYSYKYEQAEPTMEDVLVEFKIVCEVENFQEPVKIDYQAIHKWNYEDKVYTIKNADIQHQTLDKMIFPEVVLPNRPSKFSSKQVYNITRQYVREHIDNSVAKITSDYDFCFTVKKLIPKIEPETISYSNIFARTKRERTKIHYSTKKFEEVEIFEMTSAEDHYQGYTAIPEIVANSEAELKERVDEWLTTLIGFINYPLHECPCCKGIGYQDEIKKIDKNDIIKNINTK